MSFPVTGERVVTDAGGFNPTWQRHVAAYALTAAELPLGRIADVGCGVGHSYRLLDPRETVGVDVEASVLEGQDRPTVAADMRALPFADDEFDGAVAIHSIEHVPDPEHAVTELARVIRPWGAAVLVTPNRLTFARPEEIIDPYHHVELDPEQMRELCTTAFRTVRIAGLFGSERYLGLVAREREKLDRLLRADPLRLRRLVPRRVRQRLYDRRLSRERAVADPASAAIGVEDFTLAREELGSCLDVVAVCRDPLR